MIKKILLWLLLGGAVQATTLYDLRVSVYDLLSADSTNRVLDSLLVDRCINLAIPVVSTDARCVVAYDRSAMTKFVVEYFIDSTMVRDGVLDVYIKNMESSKLADVLGLTRRDIQEFGRTGEKRVNIYDVIGWHVVLYNVPQTTDESDSLIVAYAKIGSSLADRAAVTDIPDDYKLAICYKACEFIYTNRRLEGLANYFSGLYDNEIAKKRSINPPDSLQRIVPNR